MSRCDKMSSKVRIFTTPGCGYCSQAKQFLTEKGVEFEAFDVSSDKDAMQEMRKMTGGARSVPVIAGCDKVLIGFDRTELENALKCLE